MKLVSFFIFALLALGSAQSTFATLHMVFFACSSEVGKAFLFSNALCCLLSKSSLFSIISSYCSSYIEWNPSVECGRPHCNHRTSARMHVLGVSDCEGKKKRFLDTRMWSHFVCALLLSKEPTCPVCRPSPVGANHAHAHFSLSWSALYPIK